MSEPFSLAFLGTLLAAGLAGSLHCVGMCGPILVGFTQVVGRAPGGRRGGAGSGVHAAARPGAVAAAPAAPFPLDFFAYHAGRVWTYAMLGLAAGLLGARARAGAAFYGWQRPVTLVLAVVVIAAGVLLLGILPAGRVEAFLNGCGLTRLRGRAWFASLAAMPGPLPRLLLGAIMGLLPCGLVYAMLALVAALPTPAHAAFGMLVFGLGTIPSLTAVLLFGRSIAAWVRRHGTRLVATALIVTGAVMLWRGLASPAGHAGHAAGHAGGPGAGDAATAALPPGS